MNGPKTGTRIANGIVVVSRTKNSRLLVFPEMSPMRIPNEGHFVGCLIGQCLGDALGFLVEGFPSDECEAYVSGEMQSWFDGEMGGCTFGQYTDDSQLARELIQSIVATHRFDPSDYADRIASIFREDRIVGRGLATHNAAMRLVDGVSWEESGTPAPQAGNGSAMRAAPIGLFFFDDLPQLISAARDQGTITHLDSRCSAGSAAIAGAVALALCCRSIEATRFADEIAACVRPLNEGFSESLRQLGRWTALPISEAAQAISSVGVDAGSVGEWDKISPFVIPSVLWSLYSFLRSPEDYWESIRTAIRVGGDVDTTAAMTGAISGAHLGIEVIPEHLAERLHDRGHWSAPQLSELAIHLYRLKFVEQ